MAKLKAARSILYLNRVYEAGEELPYYDAATVKAWIECKSAYWEAEESDRAKAASADTTLGDAAEAKVKKASQTTKTTKKKASTK